MDAAEVRSEGVHDKSSLQEAVEQGQQDVTSKEDLTHKAEEAGHEYAVPIHTSQSEHGTQDQAAKTGCACCALM